LESTLKQKLNDDLRQALRGRDKCRSSVLRLLLSAIHNTEIAKQASLEDADVLGAIAKEAKQRKESIEAFRQGNRPNLVAQEEAELVILQGYLPQQMSRQEITEAAKKVIEETGACSPRDKGKVMGTLIPQLKGRAEGQVINQVVSELLG